MLRSARFLAFALVLAGGAVLAACDAGSADGDVTTLLDDARIARQGGDLDEAINLLEQAHQLEPGNDAVGVELASTYLQQEDIDLLDIDRLVLYITNEAGGSARPTVPPPAGRSGATCTFEDDPTATPFDPRGVEGYPDLFDDRATIEDVLDLLHEAPEGDVPTMPEALRSIELCSAVVDGHLNYDRAAALAALRATGLSDDEIVTALGVNAAARFLDGYFFLVEDLPQQTTWYTLADGTIGVCAEDTEALRAQAETALADLFEALASLDLRAEMLGGSTPSRDIVDNAVAAYEALTVYLGPYCNG